MLRRRSTAYTCMYIAGITAGYFMLEKEKIVAAGVFMVSVVSAIFLLDLGIRDEKRSREKSRRYRINLAFFVLLGFFVFLFHFLKYEGIDLKETDAEYHTISGKVISTEKTDYGTCLTIRPEENRKYGSFPVLSHVARNQYNVRVYQYNDNDIEDLIRFAGADVRARGKISEFQRGDNPGCFDYRLYMRSLGTAYGINAGSIEITDPCDNFANRCRRFIIRSRENFLVLFDEDVRGFIRGAVFGDKSEIDDDTLREFNMNSSGHILAVSGLHIGFLYTLLKSLSGRRKTLPVSIAVILLLLLYGEMTEWSASTVRAVIVISMRILSIHLYRPFDLLTSVTTAAFAILIFNPYMLFNSGFSMSFAALSAIAFLSKPLSAYVGTFLGTVFAVQIGTIPVIATTFYRINLLAAFINIPIILLSSFMIPLCMLSLFISIAVGILPGFLISFLSFVCRSLIYVNHILSFDGGFSMLTPGAVPFIAISIYIALIIISSEWLRINMIRKNGKAIIIVLLSLIIPLSMCFYVLRDTLSDDEIVFVAVGQGDCVHVRSGDRDIMIDGGGSDRTNIGESILMPYLLGRGAPDLDIAVLTHLHTDHYKGILELSEIYPIRSMGIPSDYEQSIKAEGAVFLSAGSVIRIDEKVFVEMIWPVAGETKSIRTDDPNEHNAVYLIHYYDLKILVTGDLLEEDEKKMLKHYKGTDTLDCDILKVAHHGSKSSSSEEFLDAADPKIAVIQVGRNNMYGHPHSQTLERLDRRGIKVYRTDTDGAVGIDFSKKNGRFSIHTMH